MESGDPILNYYPEDFEGEKQLGGFAVYENKVAIYGNRGIYTSDVWYFLNVETNEVWMKYKNVIDKNELFKVLILLPHQYA